MRNENTLYHVVALVTAAVWGTTFVNSKILLDEGLSPAEIMVLRFALAYVCILPFAPRRLLADNLRDEAAMAVLGITGGSLYFLLENTALVYTQASNVAIIIASAPLLTTLAVHRVSRSERVGRRLYLGSLLSLSGVALVVFNGQFILKLNPKGDLLTLGAAVMWVVYSLVVLRMNGRYSSMFMTRKIFFYGVATLMPYFAFRPFAADLGTLLRPAVAGNLLYLGIVASLICYRTWNLSIEKIGAIRATNYLYLNPVVAMITSAAVLGERITLMAVAGAALILCGVWMAERHGSRDSRPDGVDDRKYSRSGE